MTKIAIFGISGYAGQKLLEILLLHPEVCVTLGFVAPDEKNAAAEKINPRIKKAVHLECYNEIDWAKVKTGCDFAILALPHVVSMKFVPELLKAGKKVVDLSADYRFSEESLYTKWYQAHTSPRLLKSAVYGLPELNRARIKNADLVANPGCYPTASILGLLPLAKQGLLEKSVIVDAKSGFTGAGKRADIGLIFPEGNENCRAYKIGEHRHQPEIEHILQKAGNACSVLFVPHLIPVNCGIISTIYASLKKDIPEKDLQAAYLSFYEKEPFVRVMDYGVSPEIKNVVGTNFCDIGIKKTGPRNFVAVSAIDNLVKGASGQAVQNMNIMAGFTETLPWYQPK